MFDICHSLTSGIVEEGKSQFSVPGRLFKEATVKPARNSRRTARQTANDVEQCAQC